MFSKQNWLVSSWTAEPNSKHYRDTTAVLSKPSDLQTQHKNEHFLADLHIYEGKGDTSFIDWITKVKKIAKLTQCHEI